MKLQKVLNRKVKGKRYWKWRIELPPSVIDELGWAKGMKFSYVFRDGGLWLRPMEADCTDYRGTFATAKSMSPGDVIVDSVPTREEQVRHYHAEGLIDREIAAQLDLSISTVCRLRQRLGLSPNGHLRKKGFRTWDVAKARQLHECGADDQAIADSVGVSRETITKWRHRQDLPRNGIPGPKAGGDRVT